MNIQKFFAAFFAALKAGFAALSSKGNDEIDDEIENENEDTNVALNVLNDSDDQPSEGLQYALSEDGTYYKVTGVGTCEDKSLIIPSMHEGLPVKEIGNYAFHGNSNITGVTIFKGVTSIGEYAFDECDALTSVVIPDGMLHIGKRAFGFCVALTNIEIPDSVKEIGENAFSLCFNLRRITVDENNEHYCSIKDDLYSKDGTRLIQYAIGKLDNSFTLSKNVVSVDECAFSGCGKLQEIEVEEGHQQYSSIDGDLYDKDKTCLIQYAIGKKEKALILLEKVTKIGYMAFACSSYLKSVQLCGDVKEIGGYAFAICGRLTSVVLPSSVTEIGEGAFFACNSLKRINMHDSITRIGEDAFYECRNLSNLLFPEGLVYIGESAFEECSGITSVMFRNTADWKVAYRTKKGDVVTTVMPGEDLQDFSLATIYLTNTYRRCVWTCEK